MRPAEDMAPAPARARRRARTVRDVLAVTLTIGTGSLDAISFLALGSVFVSVMTGNLVLLGIAAGKGEGAVAWQVALAFAGYAAGVAIGTVIAGQPTDSQAAWPGRVNAALAAELVLLAGFIAGWELSQAMPSGVVRLALLTAASAAMGLQSAAVDRLAVPGFSSTYLTSTMIRAVAQLVRGRGDHLAVRLAALACAIGGAAGGALLLAQAPRLAPVIAVAILCAVLVTAVVLTRRGRLLTVSEQARGTG